MINCCFVDSLNPGLWQEGPLPLQYAAVQLQPLADSVAKHELFQTVEHQKRQVTNSFENLHMLQFSFDNLLACSVHHSTVFCANWRVEF